MRHTKRSWASEVPTEFRFVPGSNSARVLFPSSALLKAGVAKVCMPRKTGRGVIPTAGTKSHSFYLGRKCMMYPEIVTGKNGKGTGLRCMIFFGIGWNGAERETGWMLCCTDLTSDAESLHWAPQKQLSRLP